MNERVEELWTEILDEIGEDIHREGLRETPKRVAKMYQEIFRGYLEEPPHVTTFSNGQDGITYDSMVVDEGDFSSMCEHHVLPFRGRYVFAYIPDPKGKILGISKVARIVDHFSAKMQIQERLGQEIVEHIWEKLGEPIGMAIYMEAEHMCKTMRGVKKKGLMKTTYLKGCLKDSDNARAEFMRYIK